MIAAAFLAALASSQPVCVSYSGHVIQIVDAGGLLADQVVVNAPAMGHWRYPGALADADPAPERWAADVAPGARYASEVRAGSFAARTLAYLSIEQVDGTIDRQGLSSGWVESTAPGMSTSLELHLADDTGQAVAAADLPGVPDLARWKTRYLYLDGCVPPDCYRPAWRIWIEIDAVAPCDPTSTGGGGGPLLRAGDKRALPLDSIDDRWLDTARAGDVDRLDPWAPLAVYSAPDGLVAVKTPAGVGLR